uniref:dUTP diphosphatase n=1 Tax=viral metagenome TaxID=1070528 RepID=A0A6C0B497_9ZZZZ
MTSFDYESFLNNMNVNNGNKKQFAVLKLFVNPDNNELRELYENHVNKHNNEVIKSSHPNSGFDLFIADDVTFNQELDSKFVDLEIHCEMINSEGISSGFYLFPRSSISKTPLMLANHTGVIDSGYRGRMIGAFRWLNSQESHESSYTVEKRTRLLQICHPSLCPVIVKIVNDINDLSNSERGSGGFGSTGR